MFHPIVLRVFAATLIVSAAGTASAHPSLVPHAHPHGETLILGLDHALLALAAVVIVAVAALAVGRARARAAARRRRP